MSGSADKREPFANLPTRLTPMEQLHLLRDSDEYPNAILARLILEGEINRQLFEQALQFVASRHEMFNARLADDGKSWQLRTADEPATVIRWFETEYNPDQHRIKTIRLSTGPACQCDIFMSDNRVNLLMQMHHAQVDGLGAIQGIREILQAYHNLCNKQPIDSGLRRLDPKLFPRRGRIGLFQKGWWKRVPLQWIPIFGASKFAFAKISHLIPNWKIDSPQEPAEYFPTLCHRRLEPETFQQLRAGDRSSNDRLLASLYLAVDRFQGEINQSRGKQKIRIVVPISVREREDLRSTICNHVALIQLDRGEKDFADPEGLVWGINYELGIVSKYKFEKSFAIALRLMSSLPPFFRWRMKRRTIRTTTVLTNLGNPFRNMKLPKSGNQFIVGDMKLIGVDLIPPIYELTPAVFLFSTYAGVPRITMNFDQRVISRQQAERLMDIYIEEIQRMADNLSSWKNLNAH